MKPEDCPRLDQCSKLKMILDKDLLDFQYAEAIRVICAHCSEFKAGSSGRVDKAGGFSVVTDDGSNTTLLKWGKPVAWFSAAVSGEVLRVFLELIKECERSAKGDIQFRKPPRNGSQNGYK